MPCARSHPCQPQVTGHNGVNTQLCRWRWFSASSCSQPGEEANSDRADLLSAFHLILSIVLFAALITTGSLYLSWGVLLGLGLHHRCPGGEQLLLWEMGLSCSGWKWRIWSKLSWLLMIGHYSNARSVFSWQFSFTCHSYFSPAPPLAVPNPKPQFPDNPPNSSWTALVSLHRVLSLLCQ